MKLSWIQVTLILCAFGLLKEYRPSEMFVWEFLLGEWREITQEQLMRQVFPISTYCYVGLLVIVFLITDFLRFKPVIVLCGLSGIAVYTILLWTTSLQWLQASQFFYGLYMATEVAYYTYIYAKVDSDKYRQVSSYTRIATLTGRFLSGVTSQLLTHFQLMDYRDLNYITFSAQILATFWALWLPTVPFGIYFHQKTSVENPQEKQIDDKTNESSFRSNVAQASTLITRHAKAAYKRPKVQAWSVLYAVSLALFAQTQIYVQLRWRQIQEDIEDPKAYNGAVEAAQTLCGAGGAFMASVFATSSIPAPVAALQALAVFFFTFVDNLYVAYAGYIVAGTLFNYMITLASARIASQLSDESCFGLIFGINTLLGTGLQSILTLTLIQGMKLTVSQQYYVVSALYAVLACGWLVGWIVTAYRKKKAVNQN